MNNNEIQTDVNS